MNRPRYHLALFDDAPWKEGDPDRRKTGDPKAGGGRRKAAEAPKPPQLRDPKTGEFVTIDKLEAVLKERADKEHELNQENAKRRAENNELKSALKKVVDAHDSVRARALRTEVMAALATAKAVDPDVVADAFMRWAGDKVKMAENMAVEGLTPELVADFVKVKPKLFEVAGSMNGGAGSEPIVIDKDTKPNATAIGASTLAAGSDGLVTGVKLDFSKGNVDEVVARYKESLR